MCDSIFKRHSNEIFSEKKKALKLQYKRRRRLKIKKKYLMIISRIL